MSCFTEKPDIPFVRITKGAFLVFVKILNLLLMATLSSSRNNPFIQYHENTYVFDTGDETDDSSCSRKITRSSEDRDEESLRSRGNPCYRGALMQIQWLLLIVNIFFYRPSINGESEIKFRTINGKG